MEVTADGTIGTAGMDTIITKMCTMAPDTMVLPIPLPEVR